MTSSAQSDVGAYLARVERLSGSVSVRDPEGRAIASVLWFVSTPIVRAAFVPCEQRQRSSPLANKAALVRHRLGMPFGASERASVQRSRHGQIVRPGRSSAAERAPARFAGRVFVG